MGTIVDDNILVCLDPGSSRSYPGTGQAYFDLVDNYDASFNNYTLADGFSEQGAGSFYFSGVAAERIVIGDTAETDLTDCTFCTWFKLPTLSANDYDIFAKGSHATNEPILCWFDAVVSAADAGNGNTNCVDLLVHDGTTQHRIATSSESITSGVWYNLAVVVEPSINRLAIYLNGELNVENTKSYNGIKASADQLVLGANSTNGSNPMQGHISAFHVYTKALSAAEIKQNYIAQRGRYE